MPQAATEHFMKLGHIQKRAHTFEILVRGHGSLTESWSFFCAQPSPPPPTWWRYSTKTEQNQHIIDNLPDLDQGSDLWVYHCSRDSKFEIEEPTRIIPMTKRDFYLDEREYETFTVGSLLREATAQADLYEGFWNSHYAYDLVTVAEVSSTLTATSTFIIHLDMSQRSQRSVVGSSHLKLKTAGSAVRPPHSTPQLSFDTGKLLSSVEEVDLPPLPEMGTNVSILGAQEEFAGSVIAADDQTLTLEVVRVRGSGGTMLTGRRDRFRFGNPGAVFKMAKKLIQRGMWASDSDTWLKDLLLAHNNNTIALTNPPPVRPWPAYLPGLNEEQHMAFMRMTQISPRIEDKITIIEGPPGTGKTRLIGAHVLDCLHRRQKWLLTAETHYAVEVCADRILHDLQARNESHECIFLIEHPGLEKTDYVVHKQPEGGLLAPSSDTPEQVFHMSALTRAKVLQQLVRHTESKPFSLTSFVLKRLSLRHDGHYIRPEEKTILDRLATAQHEMAYPGEYDSDEYRFKCHTFDHCWQAAQEYFVQYHARGIMVTAATATTPILRNYRPIHIIIDEASQLTEYNTVPVLVRFFSRCQKLVLVGDEKQRRPFQLGAKSEFVSSVEQSLMTRLRGTGVPLTKLTTQYRMHKDIALTVSTLFYNSTLVNDASVESRPEYQQWRRFHQRIMPNCGKRHSVFVHVPLSTLYRQKKNQSRMNPDNLCVIKNLVDGLKAVNATEIAILTPYKGQLRLHRKIQDPDIKLASVDSAQGKEYDFVILDLVTPGGQRHSLGFLTDPRRVNVALSRAKMGLLIVGDKDMGKVRYPTAGSKIWDTIIAGHAEHNAIHEMVPGLGSIQTLNRGLHIPGTDYELE